MTEWIYFFLMGAWAGIVVLNGIMIGLIYSKIKEHNELFDLIGKFIIKQGEQNTLVVGALKMVEERFTLLEGDHE